MVTAFKNIEWHDVQIINIFVDRSSPGDNDVVRLRCVDVEEKSFDVSFCDVYYFEAKMNFGIISRESVLRAQIMAPDEKMKEIKSDWERLGERELGLFFFQIETNSTASIINIYCKEVLVDYIT